MVSIRKVCSSIIFGRMVVWESLCGSARDDSASGVA